MYSGTTIRNKSGAFIGVHQKIDRVARRYLARLPGGGQGFPSVNQILHFEGKDGPDGIKRKSPSHDEPWHFIDPLAPSNRDLVNMILDHHHNLSIALKNNERERAAFEAAWIAHAITDGLTPAHHYPLGDKILELWGKPKEARLTVKDKNIIRGSSRRDTFSKNWQYWGAKGVFSTHLLFELGIATAVKTTRFSKQIPTQEWLQQADENGLERVFLDAVDEIYRLDMYHAFWKTGWTTKLARQSRNELLPIILRTVTFAWYSASREAGI